MFRLFSSLARGLRGTSRQLLAELRPDSRRRREAALARRSTYRPALEHLEERTLMAATGIVIDAAAYKSGVADVSAPGHMDHGQRYSVTVQEHSTYWGSGALLSISYALTQGVKLDGKPVTAYSGVAGLYGYGTHQPEPMAGAVVAIPNDDAPHTVTFEISPNAPDGGNKDDGWGYVGPWVVLGTGAWSTPVPFIVGGKDATLGLSVDAALPSGSKAHVGELVTYAIRATPSLAADTLEIHATVPPGTTLVAGSVHLGGHVAADQSAIDWTFADRSTAAVTYQVRVLDAERLPTSLPELTADAGAKAVFADGSTDSRSATVHTPLLRNTDILGTVNDVSIAGFPETKTYADTRHPLAGATVSLLAPDGSLLARAVTDSQGHYKLRAPQPGSYVVDVTGVADEYSDGSDSITKGFWSIHQRRDVVIANGALEPTTLADILMPVALVNREAVLMPQLHDVQLAIALTGNLVQLPSGYDLTAAAQSLSQAIATSAQTPFNSVNDGGPNSLAGQIRQAALLEVLNAQVKASLTLADQFGKACALRATSYIIKVLPNWVRDNLPGLDSALGGSAKLSAAAWQNWLLRSVRVGLFANVIPALMGPVNQLFPQDAATQKMLPLFWNGVYNVLRYSVGKFTGQAKDDFLFECVFTPIRVALGWGYLFAEKYAWVGNQNILDDVANRVMSGNYTGDVNAMLQSVERVWSQISLDKDTASSITQTAQKYVNYLREGSGVWAFLKLMGVRIDTIQRKFSDLTVLTDRALENSPVKARLAAVTSTVGKIAVGAEAVVQAATTTAFAVAAGSPLVSLLLNLGLNSTLEEAVLQKPISADPADWWSQDLTMAADRMIADLNR